MFTLFISEINEDIVAASEEDLSVEEFTLLPVLFEVISDDVEIDDVTQLVAEKWLPDRLRKAEVWFLLIQIALLKNNCLFWLANDDIDNNISALILIIFWHAIKLNIIKIIILKYFEWGEDAKFIKLLVINTWKSHFFWDLIHKKIKNII